MTYKRLTSEEKIAIVVASGQGELIKDLATKFGVSENTIRRTIKTSEPAPVVESAAPAAAKIVKTTKQTDAISESSAPVAPSAENLPRQPIIRRKRSAAQTEEITAVLAPPSLMARASKSSPSVVDGLPPPAVNRALESDPDEGEDEDDDLTGLAGEDLDDFGDEDFEDDDDESESGDDPTEAAQMLAEESSAVEIAIYPLEAAVLPRPCYLVIDTRSELLARPLAEFRGLGHAAQDEEQQKTLPIFESRAVALRFSQRNQRIYKNSDSILRKTVVKVPDGNVLRKTTTFLQEKGITRLLIHGQVYALE